jgi:glutamine synthetase
MNLSPVVEDIFIIVYGMLKKRRIFFYDERDPQKMSEIMKQYLAGQLLLIPQLLPMFAPTINSYKRLVEGAWAPTTLTWGIDNRTVAFRVLNGSKSS